MPQDQHKVVKCKFKDQEETRATPDEDVAANAAAPTIPPHGSAASAAGRVEPPAAPITASSPAGGLPQALGALARASGWHGVAGRMLGPKADAD